MAARGRPTDYSPELVAHICEKLASGSSLRAICMADDMPSMSSVFLWLTKYPDFSENYVRAQKERSTAMFEEMLEIGDDVAPDPAAVSKAKLRVDTRKWALARMDPKRYGDKVTQEISGPEGGAIPVTTIRLKGPDET